MKKLMILTAAALAIFLAMPQFTEAAPIQNNTTTQTNAVKYTEITAATLPQAVSEAFAKNYAGYAIDKIFQGDNDTYKLVVRKDAVKSELLFTSKGELIK